MKKMTMVSSALLIVGGWQLAQAQPPGGGPGGFTPPTFDSINQADEEGNKDDHLTIEEVRAYFEEMMAGRAGGPGGGRAGGGPGGPGGEDFIATMFSNWDTDPEGGDGMITEEEWDSRPQMGGRRGGGPGGPGGPPPQ